MNIIQEAMKTAIGAGELAAGWRTRPADEQAWPDWPIGVAN
jgi:hypothetical protein